MVQKLLELYFGNIFLLLKLDAPHFSAFLHFQVENSGGWLQILMPKFCKKLHTFRLGMQLLIYIFSQYLILELV